MQPIKRWQRDVCHLNTRALTGWRRRILRGLLVIDQRAGANPVTRSQCERISASRRNPHRASGMKFCSGWGALPLFACRQG